MSWHLKEFLKDLSVASLVATRLPNVERILNTISFQEIKVFIELGPGDGAFTDQVLKYLSADSKLIVIESNPVFAEILKNKYQDERVEVIKDCASNLARLLKDRKIRDVDCILCGIPLSFFETKITKHLIEQWTKHLKANGNLIIYQALNPVHKHGLINILQERFKHVRSEIFALNLPPLFALYADKKIYSNRFNTETSYLVGDDTEKYGQSSTEFRSNF